MTVTDLDRAPATTAPGTDTPLKARPGLHYAPVPGGVYFSGTRGQFVLRGSELMYAVADGCVPLLESGTTEDALVAGFGTERARPAVRHLLARLRENGLLLDPAAFTEPEPPAGVRARYAGTLARLAARLDDPYAAFARLRRARVELRGPATATAPARRGLLRSGVTDVVPALVPVCDPAMYADPALLVPNPAGGPAVCEPTTPAGGPAADRAGTTTSAGGPAVYAREDVSPAGGPAVTDSPGDGGPRAVIEFLTGDETWTERPGTLHVPVLLGPGPVLVGPAGASPAGWAAFRDRARVWAGGAGPAAGPVAHSLAGALAAQLLADTLTGVAEPGEAHVVHGPDLTADRVTVTGGPVTEAVAVGLDDAPAEPLPEPAAAREDAAALSARWTGLFASAQGEHLPQMPLALRAAEHRTGLTDPTDTVTAWAAHQETATVAAALAALRGRGAGAAGLTREHWLLDGALRRLAERRDRFEPTGAAPPPHAEAERVLAALRTRLGAAEPVLALARTAGVDWPLASLTADGRPLAAGWGPTAAEAAYTALCTALAAAQADSAVDPLSTDALLTADDTARTALRKQLTALAVIEGQARRTDPVLGELPFWHGPVTARTAQEPTDADH